MSNRPPQRIHRVFLRKGVRATSRGHSARSLHAAVPKTHRHVARWVLVLAFIPVLFVALVGHVANR